jgi:hypothetical protein
LRAAPRVQLLIKATPAAIVEHVGIRRFKLSVTVNIKKFPREYLDQVISNPEARTAAGACTWSGPFLSDEPQASSHKSVKHQAEASSV